MLTPENYDYPDPVDYLGDLALESIEIDDDWLDDEDLDLDPYDGLDPVES